MRSRVVFNIFFLSLGFAVAVAVMAGSPVFQTQNKLFFQVDLTTSTSGLAQLFFDVGRGFIEKDSVTDGVRRNQKARHLFPLPFESVSNLRFDPINNQAEITIAAPMIVDSKGVVVRRFSSSDFIAVKDIKSIHRQDDIMTISCTEGGVDPFLTIVMPSSIGPSFVLKEWVREIAPITSVVFFLVLGLAFASYTLGGTALSKLTAFLCARPLLTLAAFALVGTLLQFHPLFFAAQTANLGDWVSAPSQTNYTNLTAYNLGRDKLGSSPAPIMGWANLFLLVPKAIGNGHRAIAAGVLSAWWTYIFGCGLLAWLITRSLGTAVLISGCALFTKVWAPGILPLSTPAIAAAPWALIAWGVVATVPKSSKLFFLAGAAVFIANLEMVAAECSLRVATLAVATAVAGVSFIGLQPQSKSSRVLRAGVGLTFFCLFAVIVALVVWRAILLPGDGTPEAARTLFQTIPASASLSFFEGFFWQSPGTYPLPSANLVVLAGLAWAFARSDEISKKPEFIALILTIAPLVVLASGAVPDNVLAAWFKHANTARFEEAAWYTLVFFSVILASFGFVGLRQLCAALDSGFYIAKATIIFFMPFVTYFGTFQYHASYTFKTAYLISVIIGWVIAHVAMARLRSLPETRVSIVLMACVLILAWWHHAAYVHLFIREALLAY